MPRFSGFQLQPERYLWNDSLLRGPSSNTTRQNHVLFALAPRRRKSLAPETAMGNHFAPLIDYFSAPGCSTTGILRLSVIVPVYVHYFSQALRLQRPTGVLTHNQLANGNGLLNTLPADTSGAAAAMTIVALFKTRSAAIRP